MAYPPVKNKPPSQPTPRQPSVPKMRSINTSPPPPLPTPTHFSHHKTFSILRRCGIVHLFSLNERQLWGTELRRAWEAHVPASGPPSLRAIHLEQFLSPRYLSIRFCVERFPSPLFATTCPRALNPYAGHQLVGRDSVTLCLCGKIHPRNSLFKAATKTLPILLRSDTFTSSFVFEK